MLWEECAAVGMPRAVVITKIDHQRADFEEMLAACQDAFGDGVAPAVPARGRPTARVNGLIGLLSPEVLQLRRPARAPRTPRGRRTTSQLEEHRGALIEGIIQESEDESLMDRYLAGEEIDTKVLIEDLEKAVARGQLLSGAVASGTGVGRPLELLELDHPGFPSPLEHPMPEITSPDGKPVTAIACDPDGPLVAEVVKTTSDPYVGRISLVRVFSGTLRPDMTVHVSGHGLADRGHEDHDVDERIGALSSPAGQAAADGRQVRGRRHRRGGQAVAGGDRRHAVGQGRAAADDLVVDARAAAAGGDPGQVQGRRRQARPGAAAGWWPRTRRSGWRTTPRPGSSCCGAWARPTPTCCSTG